MPHATKDSALKGRHILVVDDDEAIRQTMHDVLTREGCLVDVADDGQHAIELLDRSPDVDLVLSDIKMPRLNGYELYAHVRKLYPNLPVILMTAFGYDPDHSIVNARKQGLEVVLFKPFKVTVLKREIRKALLAGQRARGSEEPPIPQKGQGTP